MKPDFEAFAQALATQEKSETALAVCVLWYLEQIEGETFTTAQKIASVINQAGLRGPLNVTRLGKNLKAHGDIVNGPKPGTFRIKLGSVTRLTEGLAPLLANKPPPKIADVVIPAEAFSGTRRYLERMVLQINGSYQFQFYDGCAVLCRRIMESLLIAAFEKTGHAAAIKQGNDYLMLSHILAAARSGKYFRLSRGICDKMDMIKSVGDTAAHNRSHITSKVDIDQISVGLRQVLSELSDLADIHPT